VTEADGPARPTRVGVAVPAAGSGQRMGGARKPFLHLAGEPVLVHGLRPFLQDARVRVVVVALASADAADPPEWLSGLDERVGIVAGGESRTESVRKALAALPEDLDVIAIHDAARPLVTARTVAACIDLAASGTGAVAGCPAVDTMKRVDAAGLVVDTPERAALWHAHTPQVFPAAVVRAAYASGAAGTDDAALVEASGAPVRMVDDGGSNIKVTRASDIAIAEAILRERGGRG
jgi:2-C-methyl-D-erythritol 4-phosphate cytidylyltransferase